MADWADTEAAAAALIEVGRRRGIDFAPLCSHDQFAAPGRYLHLWRHEGEYRYYIQGSVKLLPTCLAGSESSFRGVWCESGQLPDIDRAFEFARAWLLDGTEVDQLPGRAVRSYHI